VAAASGATVSPHTGEVPGTLTVTPSSTTPVDFHIDLEYRGAAVVSPRGARTPAGAPYRFGYASFFVPIDWQVRFFGYTEATDPVGEEPSFRKLIAGAPLTTIAAEALDYVSGRALQEGVPPDRFAIVAEGAAELPPGDYTLRLISDDGARVWMDGRLILDAWTPHESRVDEAGIAGGRRTFRVEYYDVTGFAELRVDIRKR
jgi:hypothetical protein